MAADIGAMLRKIPIDKKTISSVVPLIGRYGATGALAIARGYLGPYADDVESKADAQEARAAKDQPDEATKSDETKKDGLSKGEVAVLGMAVTKLIYEAGELALHNPNFDPGGKQPEFKLDEHGRAPAMSLTHVIAATRLARAYAAERAERKQAEAEAKAAADEAAQAKALASTPRQRLLAARSERYAQTLHYSYPTSNRSRR